MQRSNRAKRTTKRRSTTCLRGHPGCGHVPEVYGDGGQTVKEYKLRVPDDTVGISITVFRQKKKKRLFSRSFKVESALETYVLDLVDEEGGQHEEG